MKPPQSSTSPSSGGTQSANDRAEKNSSFQAPQLAAEEEGDAKRATFINTLNRYSEIFSPEDLEALAQGNLRPNSSAVTTTERRRLRAQAVIAKAKRMTKSGSLASLTASNLKNPQFAKLVFES